jgi:hypothetical protein
MRSGFCLLLFVAACGSQPPEQAPLIADDFTDMFIASYVTPSPATILPGLDLPLHAGDRVIANCAQAYAYTLPEMTIEEQADFKANVTCVYPPEDTFDASYRHYALALRQRGFEDNTGSYVQSGMRIVCNETHTVVIGLQSHFTPSFAIDAETEEVIDTPGGGGLANMSLAFTVSERPCERFVRMRDTSDPPPPEKYADRPAPDFLPASQIDVATAIILLRPGDRLVAYCSQYYARELKLDPYAFADFNRDSSCILVQGAIKEASAYYLQALTDAGFNKDSPWAAPHPQVSAPESQAGVYAWSGYVSRCSPRNSVRLGAVARIGAGKLIDPLTGEVWTTQGPTGGREALLQDAVTPHAVLVIHATPRMGCEISQ